MSELGSVYEFGTDLATAEKPIPLPLGEYRGSVKAADLRVSKTSQKPMLVLTHNISPDQYPADFTDGDPDGETVTTYHSLSDTPRNRYTLRKLMEMYGVAPANRLVATDFIGQDVILAISHEEYQGMPQVRANPVRAV